MLPGMDELVKRTVSPASKVRERSDFLIPDCLLGGRILPAGLEGRCCLSCLKLYMISGACKGILKAKHDDIPELFLKRGGVVADGMSQARVK